MPCARRPVRAVWRAMSEAPLEHENTMVLALSQALLGSVFPNLRAASVQVRERGVVIHFRLDEVPSADDQDELDEIVLQFEAYVGPDAMVGGANEVSVEIHVDREPVPVISLPGRMVFARG